MVDIEPVNLFDIIRKWLAEESEIGWKYIATQIDNSYLLGSIWIKHYMLIYVYSDHIVVMDSYNSMCCIPQILQATNPDFFDELYKIVINASDT